MGTIDTYPISVQWSHFIQLEIPETSGFWCFQRGIKWEHWLLATFNISFKFNITNFSVLYLMKIQGKERFSGGSKWEDWPEMS